MPNTRFLVQLSTLLHSVRKELNMETAIVSYINGESYTLVMVDSEMKGVFEAGMVFPLDDTYCRDVYKLNQVMRYNHVGTMDNMSQHPVYLSVKLESYIAAPIHDTNGDVIGTVNFTSLFAQVDSFNEDKVTLVTNLADYIEQNINQYKSLVMK